MKTEAYEYGVLMAREALQDSVTFSGVCDCCDRAGARYKSGSGDAVCIQCVVATLAEDEAKGGYLSEWLWQGACRIPRENTRVYRETMRGFFRTLTEEGK
jgi:hypothetical protein